jgi:hypothetical protein
MSELRKNGIYVSVIHSEHILKGYVEVINADGSTAWDLNRDEKESKKFRGYLKNVVLNKILLLNSCWPFVLANPLATDLVVGIDVKNHTAGFTVIQKEGRDIAFLSNRTEEKEGLSRNNVSSTLYGLLERELEGRDSTAVRSVTIHRDGTLYLPESQGIQDAAAHLIRERLLPADVDLNLIEIRKSSRIPVRFFDVNYSGGSFSEETYNPPIGLYGIYNNNAFLCNTGRPYPIPGTASPLQVIKLSGSMAFEDIIEDIFKLSNLTWTRTDYCARLPLSIKMADIRLRELAGAYNEDELKFAANEGS